MVGRLFQTKKKRQRQQQQGTSTNTNDTCKICCSKPYEGRSRAAAILPASPNNVGLLNAPDNMGLHDLVNAIQAQEPAAGEKFSSHNRKPPARLSPSEGKQVASLAKARAKEAAKRVDPAERRDFQSRQGLFELDEIQLGPLLGVGGFSYVYEIQGFQLKRNARSANTTSSRISNKQRNRLQQNQPMIPQQDSPSAEQHQHPTTAFQQQSNLSKNAHRTKPAIKYTPQQQKVREFLAKHAQKRVVNSSSDEDTVMTSQLSLREQLSPVSAQDEMDNRRTESSADGIPRTLELHNLRIPSSNQAKAQDASEEETAATSTTSSIAPQAKEASATNTHDDEDPPVQTTARYALKHIKPTLINVPGKFSKAAMDISVEAEMLMCLDHPNIVKLRGFATGGPGRFKDGAHNSYFLIIDRLVDTLEDRILEWRERTKTLRKVHKYNHRRKELTGLTKLAQKMLGGSKKKQELAAAASAIHSNSEDSGSNTTGSSIVMDINKILLEKLRVAHDIAAGLEYLHSRNIVYRDCKSSNIGFDLHGDCKLFDFGLSRFVPSSTADKEEAFRMSCVGTRRYSAPEVERNEPYNHKADVYSLGVVFWEMLTMTDPRHAARNDEKKISHYPVCPCWPRELQKLVSSMLSESFDLRPTVKSVRLRLQHILMDINTQAADDELSLELQAFLNMGRRRSTFRLDNVPGSSSTDDLKYREEEEDEITHTSASTMFTEFL